MPHSEPTGPDSGLPSELAALLNAARPDQREAAWAAFVHRYSRLLLHTVHARSNGYDDAMDRYAHVLVALRDDDCRRLRAYDPDSRARFTTWLVVVAGRLCIDYHRKRYGAGPPGANGDGATSMRRRLVDLVSARLDLGDLSDPNGHLPDADIRRGELFELLYRALGDLDARDRWLLRLRFADDLPAREIASLMDFPTLFHVYRRVNSVLGTLRATLEERGVTDPRP